MYQKSPMIKQDFKQDLSKLILNISYKYDIKLSKNHTYKTPIATDNDLVKMTIPDKPISKNQKYYK